MKRLIVFCVLVTTMLAVVSCGGGSNGPIAPTMNNNDLTGKAESHEGSGSKAIWGVWEISIDTSDGSVDVIPVRGSMYTVDVVMFLQPPSGNPANLRIEVTNVDNWFTDGLIDVEVGLSHPFPGLYEYCGFDVMGVFMAPGSESTNYDPDILYTNGIDEPKLLNADGYTRWMNPSEFGVGNTMFEFIPGKLGNPDTGIFTSTINGYKYFADGLDVSQDLTDFFSSPGSVEDRGIFTPGSTNRREYKLDFDVEDNVPNLVFQYAVVASWIPPDPALTGDPELIDVPGDFPISVNQAEAFNIGVTDNSGLYYSGGVGGGYISLDMEIYDWGALADSKVTDEIYQVIIEGDPDVIPGGYVVFDKSDLEATGSGGTTAVSSVYTFEIPNVTPVSNDDFEVLVTIESEDPSTFDPGIGIPANDDRLASYFFYSIPVGTEPLTDIVVTNPNGGEVLFMAMDHEITWDPGTSGVTDVQIEWSTDDFTSDIHEIVASTENDGSYMWDVIPNVETTSAKIRISDNDGPGYDESDDYFEIALPIWLVTQDPIIADNDTVNFSWWPHYHWGDEFSPALGQATDGTVWVIWANNNTATNDTQIHSSDGINWVGTGNCFGTSSPNHRGDRYKVAPGTDTWCYATIRPFASLQMTVMNRLYYAAWNYNFNAGNTDINNEIATDQAGYIYVFTDGTSGITVTRSTAPNNASSCGAWGTVTTNGEVSHVRSWARMSGGLALAWFTLAGEIKVSLTTDAPTNQTWDSGTTVFDGSGYTNIEHPSLDVDPTGRLHLCFAAKNSSTGDYELLYARRETDGTWGSPVLVTSSPDPIEDQHIQYGDISTYEAVTIVYQTGGQIHSIISPSAGNAFLPPGDISPASEDAYDPDMILCDSPYTYDLVSFYAFDDGTGSGDVAWVNADFDTY